MRQVFISHSWAATDTAMALEVVLKGEGFEVITARDLAPGSDLQAGVLSAIRKSSVLVALVDHPSANVMLELGYALGAAKDVLLVGDRDTDIPFDLASLRLVTLDSLDTLSMMRIADVLHARYSGADLPVRFRSARDYLMHMIQTPEYLDEVTPREFENHVCEYLGEMGFLVSVVPDTHDTGFDLFIRPAGHPLEIIVEVKKYTRSSRVGLANVRQLLGAMVLAGAGLGMIVTTSEFSSSARGLASSTPMPILLLTLDELMDSTVEGIVAHASHRNLRD